MRMVPSMIEVAPLRFQMLFQMESGALEASEGRCFESKAECAFMRRTASGCGEG